MNHKKIISTSEQLLLAVRKAEPVDAIISAMEVLDPDELRTDAEKICFWVNLYNAWCQLLAERGAAFPRIFSEKKIRIGHHVFSLDDVEHGILRRYRWKYGLGYLADPFTSPAIRKLAVEKPEYRIHFALNCGVASCPPILHYSLDRLEEQLEMAAHSFLRSSCSLDQERKIMHVSRIMLWYIGDFGGRSGIRRLMSRVYAMDLGGYGIRFLPYNWGLKLRAFADQDFR